MPYKKEIKDKIKNNQLILATGNSWEIFGKYIEDENNKKINALGLFEYFSKRNLKHRHNSLFLGQFNNIEIVGYKSQFSQTFNNNHNFIKVKRGIGSNPDDSNEGIRYKNFFGTYILGPILIINPYFTKYIFELLNYKEELAFEQAAIDAYEYRLKELKDEKTKIIPNH